MLPRWHIFWGALFSLGIWYFSPGINLIYVLLVFFASVMIDFDHYAASCLKSKKVISLLKSFEYHREKGKEAFSEKEKGILRRGDFHLFHTIEFHAIIGLLGIVWIGFFYLFIGMIFHSLLDVFYLLHKGMMHRREYFLTSWLLKLSR